MTEVIKAANTSADILRRIDNRSSNVNEDPTIVDLLTKRQVTADTVNAVKGTIHGIIGGCRAVVFSLDMHGKPM